MVKIVQTARFLTLLGGGHASAEELAAALSVAPILVAADSGADTALALGHMPEAVIGDLDSISPQALARLPAERVHRIAEQETTDFDKALRSVAAPLVVALGVAGPRADHGLAAMATLARHADRRVILLAGDDIVFHTPSRLVLATEPGQRVSLFPLAQLQAASEGLAWPLDGLMLDPLGRIATSNRATGHEVVIAPQGPGLLTILPRASLPAAVAALAGAPPGPPPAR